MVTFFEGRGDILLGLGTRNAFICAQEFLDVLPWGHAHGSIIFPDKVTTEVKANRTHTFQLKLILVLQKISDSLRVFSSSSSNIIHIDSYVLIDIAILLHPDIWFSLAWRESHVSEAIGKALMPMEARSPEAIEGLEDDEGVPFKLTKFRTRKDINLFLSFHLKISIADVGGPDV